MSNFVPEGWTQISLPEVCYFQEGPGLRNWQYRPSGFPFINIRCIREGFLDLDKVQHISTEEALERYQHFFLDEGDYVLSSSGTLGRMAKIKKADLPLMLNTSVIRFRSINEDLLWQDFLPYYLQSPEFVEQITEESQGSAQVNFGPTHLKLVESYFPPLPEQQKIATILSSVDDVIEKTRAQIDKLKDLKTGMMQELLTKGIGHTEFKDSPMGRIPAAWGCKTLDQLAAFVTSGSRGWAQYYSDAGPIFIRIGNLTREHINLRFNDTVHVSPPDSAEGKRTQVQLGDVLISITADLGVIGVVNESIGEAYVNQHISLVRLRDSSEARWVGHFLAFENTQKQFTANNDSGAKAGLNLPAIRNTLVAMPAKNERDKIVETLDSIDTDIVMKRTMLERISSVKKALMQDLLTGKVRVKTEKDVL